MSGNRWPSGPQKLSKIEAPSTGRLRRTNLEYQELGRLTPMVVVDSLQVSVDYEIEARLLATKEEKK